MSVIEVTREDFRETARGIGTLRADEVVEVSPELDGIVEKIHFCEGEDISRGDMLVTLDDRKLQRQLSARKSALAAAEARLENARSTFRRVERLVESNAATADEYDEAKANYEAARNERQRLIHEVELIAEQIDDTQI